MTRMRGRYGWMAALVVALALLLALAWRDAGSEPLHDLAEPVPLPEGAR